MTSTLDGGEWLASCPGFTIVKNKNIGVLSTFHVEKPTMLLPFSNVKNGTKKRKIQRLDNIKPL
jgi:hypothetical protein